MNENTAPRVLRFAYRCARPGPKDRSLMTYISLNRVSEVEQNGLAARYLILNKL